MLSLMMPTYSLITPRRMDIAIKYRFFRHLMYADDPEATYLYQWHILERSGDRFRAGRPTDGWKLSVDDYVRSAAETLVRMDAIGFDMTKPIPLDKRGELLDGSHRLSCALALEIDSVPVITKNTQVWAPPWGEAWFRIHGMDEEMIEDLKATLLYIQTLDQYEERESVVCPN